MLVRGNLRICHAFRSTAAHRTAATSGLLHQRRLFCILSLYCLSIGVDVAVKVISLEYLAARRIPHDQVPEGIADVYCGYESSFSSVKKQRKASKEDKQS